MSSRVHLRSRFSLIVATLLLCPIMLLGAPAARAQLRAETLLDALVGLEIKVLPDARTVSTLGLERSGTGIVIDDAGLVLTIGYLILEAEQISVRTAGGRTLPAVPVAYLGETGFGLLRVQGNLGKRSIPLGRSDVVEAGDTVLVAGFGGIEAIRPALVVDRREFTGPWEYLLERAIFTAPPHPSYGGAALVGEDGTLLGVGYLLVAAAAGGQSPVPGNMFVPVDELKPILPSLLAHGRGPGSPRPWLGLYTSEVKGRLFVDRVAAEGPADAAGIRSGDLVLAIAGEPVTSMSDFYRKLWARGPAGVEVPLLMLQQTQVREVTIRSGDRYKWFRPARTF